MLISLTVIITIAIFTEASEFPNGTENRMNFFSCSSENIISVSSIELLDQNDLPMYPIKLGNLATVKLKAYNNGNIVAKDKVNVEIYAYVEENGTWKWENIIPEAFRFLLYNIDGCKMAHNCPLTEGDLKLVLPLNLYKFAILFGFVDTTLAHQLVIKLYDAENRQEVSCEVVQFKLI